MVVVAVVVAGEWSGLADELVPWFLPTLFGFQTSTSPKDLMVILDRQSAYVTAKAVSNKDS